MKLHGFVVALSGIQLYFDQMINYMVADTLKALAMHAYATNDIPEKLETGPFV